MTYAHRLFTSYAMRERLTIVTRYFLGGEPSLLLIQFVMNATQLSCSIAI